MHDPSSAGSTWRLGACWSWSALFRHPGDIGCNRSVGHVESSLLYHPNPLFQGGLVLVAVLFVAHWGGGGGGVVVVDATRTRRSLALYQHLMTVLGRDNWEAY